MGTSFRELEASSLAAMTPKERAFFDAALELEEARLLEAEHSYVRATARGSHTAPPQVTGRVESADSP